MALLANCHRDPKQKRTPYKPADFNPMIELEAKEEVIQVDEGNNIALLREAFGVKGDGEA